MIIDHPQYPGLKIVHGEPAQLGMFYSPKSGDTLTRIANAAYGAGTLQYALKINRSKWNVNHLIYRFKSGSCMSKKMPGEVAYQQSSFGSGAWIALCLRDRGPLAESLGFTYPILWIPPWDNAQPEDLMDKPTFQPGVDDGSTPSGGMFGPGEQTDPSGGGVSRRTEEFDPMGPGGNGEVDPTVPEKKFPWWIVGAGVVGVGIIALVVAGRDKK